MLRDISYDREWRDSCVECQLLLRKLDADRLTFHPPAPEVEIRISGDEEKIVITDNGIGISKENTPHIFDKFYRVTNGDTYEVGGYGLGLFYVKQIVDLMGWRISVDSSLGKGTSFTINFKEDEKE